MASDVEIDPRLEANITSRLSGILDAANERAEEVLREDLSQEEGGRGRKYSNLPNRSSAPGQHPRQQFGDLSAGVFSQPTNDPLTKQVGIANNPQEKLNRLAFDPYFLGGRKLGYATFQSARTRLEMIKAARKKAGS